MGFRVVLIGGGSCNWTPTFASDLFHKQTLAGCSLVLVDKDPTALSVMLRYCKRMQQEYGSNWEISAAPLEEALLGANVVCISISTGGFQAMAADCAIPEKYGVFHTVGDSVGPAGISRTLRNVPIFVDIARKMEALCPEAWLVHVTNPLSQLTRVVAKETSIKCVGLCHNYTGTIAMLAGYFGVPKEDIHAVSVGVNHFTWLKNITVKGKLVDEQLTAARYAEWFRQKNGIHLTHTTDDLLQPALVGKSMEYWFNFVLFEQLGYFPVGSSNHVAENLPFYCNSLEVQQKYHIRRKGVMPIRQEMKDKRFAEIQEILDEKQPFPTSEPSQESFSAIVESLATGVPSRAIVSMPNQGQITNLPMDVVVETWAEINGSGIFPLQSGDIPGNLAGWMQAVVDEQELSVAAALSGDRKLVLRAMMVSPELQNKDGAPALMEELLEANKEWLPQFYPRASQETNHG